MVEDITLGLERTETYIRDAKKIAIDACRYKFCSRILDGKEFVLEIGCNVGLFAPIVAQTITKLIAIDKDINNIFSCKKRLGAFESISFFQYDITKSLPDNWIFDAIYSLDTIEHINKQYDDIIMDNICQHLHQDGICIIGTPNKLSAKYAAEISKRYHVNLKTYEELKQLMEKYFKNVLMFCMNDEIVHTGFPNMAHYFIAIGIGKK